MNLSALDQFYENQPEDRRSVYLYLREFILGLNEHITPEWKYKLPFFYYKGRMLCYLWMDKSNGEPYIGFAHAKSLEHPALVSGDRKWVKVLPIPVNKDIPIRVIEQLVELSIQRIDSSV